MPESPLLLIGCGKMGASLAHGWVRSNIGEIHVIDPNPLPDNLASLITQYAPHLNLLPRPQTPYTAIIIATKPNQIDDVCHALSHRSDLCGPNTLVISIAAGRTTTSIASSLPPGTIIVRAMPNLPVSVGAGITALYTAPHTPSAARTLAHTLCESVGDVVWIDDEALIDSVTALSGSGPAYVFLLIEAMAQAGVALGLPPETSMHLARQTVIGAAELVHHSPEMSPETLRKNVTSPGGTTAAALNILMAEPGGIPELLTKSLIAARDRSRELSRS